MPTYVTLEFSTLGRAAAEIGKCESLREAIAKSKAQDGIAYVEATGVAIERNLYGREMAASLNGSDVALLAQYKDIPIFCEDDLQIPNGGGYMGLWNLNFLRWIKSIAKATGEKIILSYVHERGDDPYETAEWIFDFTSTNAEQERFNLTSYMDESWSRTVIRNADGSAKLRIE